MRLASDGGGRLPGDFAPAESIRDTAEDTCRQRQLRFKLSRGNAFPIQPGGWAVGSILHQREVGAKRGSVRGAPARMSAAPRAAPAPAPAPAPAAPTSRPSVPATTTSPLSRHKPGSAPQTQTTTGPVLGFGVAKGQTTIDRWLPRFFPVFPRFFPVFSRFFPAFSGLGLVGFGLADLPAGRCPSCEESASAPTNTRQHPCMRPQIEKVSSH